MLVGSQEITRRLQTLPLYNSVDDAGKWSYHSGVGKNGENVSSTVEALIVNTIKQRGHINRLHCRP